MDTVAIFCAILLVLIVYFLKCRGEDRIVEHVRKIPGPIKLPFVGTLWVILVVSRTDFFRLAKRRLSPFGKIFRTWLGNKPIVNLIAPEYVEQILNNSVQINKSFFYKSLEPWLGQGLLTSTGERWHQHRKLITPTFHFTILNSFMEVFDEKSQILTQQLQSKANGEVFDMYPYITNCALDIICETAMGVHMNAMSGKNNEYVQAVLGISELITGRTIKPWLYPDFIYFNTTSGRTYNKYLSTLHNFTRKVIDERKALYKKTAFQSYPEDDVVEKRKRQAFLDLLIDASENDASLTDNDIREEVDTFMFEGHDTTTAGICWSLFSFGNHPEIQEEVFQEIESVLQGENRPLTVNDLGELKLLERCIKETLRLYPSVPIISRTLSEDVNIKNYTIPAGCTVDLPIFLIHREEKYFPEPDRFNPDRFLPENVVNRHPYAYIPFSAGPRNCIGQKFAMYEEKTILAHILRKFRVKAIENQETVRPMMDLVLRPLNGLKVMLEPRV